MQQNTTFQFQKLLIMLSIFIASCSKNKELEMPEDCNQESINLAQAEQSIVGSYKLSRRTPITDPLTGDITDKWEHTDVSIDKSLIITENAKLIFPEAKVPSTQAKLRCIFDGAAGRSKFMIFYYADKPMKLDKLDEFNSKSFDLYTNCIEFTLYDTETKTIEYQFARK